MGIDIYATWKGMTDEEKEAQYTGFSVEHGHIGYLREAYHGEPYVSSILIPESYEHEDYVDDLEDSNYQGVEIDASVMEERLPAAVITSLQREATVYKNTDARDLLMEIGIEPIFTMRNEGETLRGALERIKGDISRLHDEPSQVPIPQKAITGAWLIRVMKQSPPTKSIIDFVALCREKQDETGLPCRVANSY